MAKNQYQIYVAPSVPRAKVRAAARLINKQSGDKVVKIVGSKRRADAVVRAGDPRGDYAGYTSLRGKKRDRITLDSRLLGSQGATPKYVKTLAAHEVGHGLGLGHKAGTRNLMNPDITGTKLAKGQRRRIVKRYTGGAYR